MHPSGPLSRRRDATTPRRPGPGARAAARLAAAGNGGDLPVAELIVYLEYPAISVGGPMDLLICLLDPPACKIGSFKKSPTLGAFLWQTVGAGVLLARAE
jgi:hypothetical protein